MIMFIDGWRLLTDLWQNNLFSYKFSNRVLQLAEHYVDFPFKLEILHAQHMFATVVT